MGKNLFIGLVAIFILSACSNNSNPIAPGSADENFRSEQPSVSKSDNLNEGVNPYRGVFGAWKVIIDPDTLTAEIEPARNAQAVGLIVDADLSQFLTVSPCSNCLQIPRVRIDEYGDIDIDIRMKHPFPNLLARPDLHGFDVRAIFIGEYPYSWNVPEIQVMNLEGVEEGVSFGFPTVGMLNWDGFTSHFDEILTDTRYFMGGTDVPGNLNPFIRFFEDYRTDAFDPASPVGHNVMPCGSNYSTKTVVYRQYLDAEWLEFYIVADVAYGQSAVLANRHNPQYYLPAFNRTEPWRVEYYLEHNTLIAGLTSSSVEVVVQVFDWQQGATVDPSYPNPSNLAGIPESSDVASVELAVPSLMPNVLISTSPESGTGTPSDPLQYRFTVTNTLANDRNSFGLIAVRDNLYGHTGRHPIPESPAGFPYETNDILDYAIYYPITINFKQGYFIPLDNLTEIDNELYYYLEDTYTRYHRTVLRPYHMMDRGRTKFQYGWDYDYDGVTFDVDGEGLPSPEIDFGDSGRFDVGLRVRTNSVPSQEYIYTIPVYSFGVAYSNRLLTATLTEDAVSRTGSASIAIADDNLYVAYPKEESSERNLWCAIYDRDGNVYSHMAASSSLTLFDPTICVVDNGLHDGIYIVYSGRDTSTGQIHLYFISSSLDGSDFPDSTPVRITTGNPGYELFPQIEYRAGYLYVYYLNSTGPTAQIFCADSDDFGDTWIEEGLAVDNGSDQHIRFDVVYGTRGYIVWEDYSTMASGRGSDLFYADTTNYTDFTNIQNISPFAGNVFEVFPSVDIYNTQMAISFTKVDIAASETQTNVMVYNTNGGSRVVERVSGYTYSPWVPLASAVATSANGHITVGTYVRNSDTHEIRYYVRDLYMDNDIGDFNSILVLDESIGTPAENYTYMFPALVSDAPNYAAVENFTVWQDFVDGEDPSTISPYMSFGKIRPAYFITEGNVEAY
jgi:hypothetical protein